MTTLRGTLELKTGKPLLFAAIRVRMTVTNESDQPIDVVSPDVGIPPPELKWTASLEAYHVGVLTSFNLLEIQLRAADGTPVTSRAPMPWVTPIFGKHTLQPRGGLAFEFDVNELFEIASAGKYRLQVQYGDAATSADATLDFEVRAP